MGSSEDSEAAQGRSVPQRPMPAWAIWCGVSVLIAVATVSIVVLFNLYGDGTEQDRVRLEIVRLVGTIVAGTGGLAALILLARRQLTNELELEQQERVAADTRHDALERRITDLYSTAAEQLASEKAPGRIAAMLTLERLGQEHPAHRQAVVDLLCAYLRMPFQFDDLDSERREELQIRLAAQRVLTTHMRIEHNEPVEPTSRGYWPDMRLDLTKAVLVDWKMNGCHVHEANFQDAQFAGVSRFGGAEFHDAAIFVGASFHRDISFENVEFHDVAFFYSAEFHGYTSFQYAKFHEYVGFDETVRPILWC